MVRLVRAAVCIVSDVCVTHIARHVFATLFDLGPAYEKLSAEKRRTLRVHFTLLDHQPAMIARDLCVLMLLNQLMAIDESDIANAVSRAEIEATLAYTYVGLLMPNYCAERYGCLSIYHRSY